MTRLSLVGALASLSVALPTLATPRPEDVAVRVSLSRDDPYLHSEMRTIAPGGFVEFFVFFDGQDTVGGELGLDIEGGEFIAYVIDTSKTWLAMPHIDPYPGTISQVRAGPHCYEPPVYLGRILVRPDSPDGRVDVHVITSEIQQFAVILGCDDDPPTNGFRAYPATLNGPAQEPYMVYGTELEGIRRDLDVYEPPEEDGNPEDGAGPPDPGAGEDSP